MSISIYLLLSIFSFLLNYQDQASDMIAKNKRFIQQDIAALIREMENNLTYQGQQAAKNSLLARGVNQNYIILTAINDRGQIIYSTRQSTVNMWAKNVIDYFDSGENRRAIESKKILINYDSNNKALNLYAPLKLVRNDGEIRSLRTGSLFLNYSLENDFSILLDRVIRQSLIIAFVFGLTLLCVIFFIYRYVRKPSDHLLDITENFAINQQTARTNISGRGEFARIGSAFNQMADELVISLNLQQEAQSRALWNKRVLDSVFNSIPDLFFLMDENFTIMDFRTGNKDALYKQPTEFLNKSMLDVLPPRNSFAIFKRRRGLIRKRENYYFRI